METGIIVINLLTDFFGQNCNRSSWLDTVTDQKAAFAISSVFLSGRNQSAPMKSIKMR